MRSIRPSYALRSTLSALLLLSVPFAPIGIALAQELCVPDDYPTIQAAIDAADDGDTINVLEGDYLEKLQIEDKDLTISGPDGAAVTTIDGSTTFSTNLSATIAIVDCVVSLTGFTITGSTGTTVVEAGIIESTGGGVFVFEGGLTLTDCTLIDNECDSGGGAVNGREADITIENCEFSENSGLWGGAIYVADSSLTIVSSSFEANSGGVYGGAVYADASIDPDDDLSVDGCHFSNNTSVRFGAIGALLTSSFEDTVFEDNSTTVAAGALAIVGPSSVVHCEFVGNTTGPPGGAIATSTATGADIVFEHCLIAGNEAAAAGGGVHCIGTGLVEFRHCTIADNVAGATSAAVNRNPNGAIPELLFNSCILWGNGPVAATAINPLSLLTIEYSLVEGGAVGVGNLDEDPLFVDPALGDYRLTEDSPCIDTGDPLSPLDPDGSLADMGALPVAPEFLRGDVDGDGAVSTLVDALMLLEFGFVAGSAAPPCLDAADVDGDGILSPLLDSFALLTFTLAGGPTPPAPGPDECGPNPGGAALGCATLPSCP